MAAMLIDRVRERILAGEVASHLSIRQDVLAAELGVSKIPLREALARLEEEGLVRAHPNRGFFVRPLSRGEAEEVYALRLKLEPEATAQAALQADEEQRETARGALRMLSEARAEGTGAVNRAFHLALIRPCGQAVTTAILDRLQILSERYVRKHLEPLGRDARADEEHRALIEAWLARDGETVADLVRRHLDQALSDLRRQLSENGEIE